MKDYYDLTSRFKEKTEYLEEQIKTQQKELTDMENRISKDLENYVFATDYDETQHKLLKELNFKIESCLPIEQFELLVQRCDSFV